MSEELKKSIENGLAKVKQELDAKLSEHTETIEKGEKASTELTGKIEALAEKNQDLEKQMLDLAQKSTGLEDGGVTAKSLGGRFSESDEFKSMAAGQTQQAKLEIKAAKDPVTSDPSAGTVFSDRRGGVQGGDFAPLTIRDILTEIPVTSSSVDGIAEQSWESNAAETAQKGEKPESEIKFEQVTTNIKTVAHWLKVSNQLLADAPAIATYIDTRLLDGLAQRVDKQLIAGAGTAELDGFTLAKNHTVYTPEAGDNLADAISRAKWNLWAAGNTPEVVIVNPADWGELERLKSNDGVYLFGTPGTVAPEVIFNVPTVISNHVTKGKFIVGAVRSGAILYARQAKTIDLGYVNDDFTKNLVTIRAEERLGLHVDKASGILFGEYKPA